MSELSLARSRPLEGEGSDVAGTGDTARRVLFHLLCLVLPLTSFLFVATGPHASGVGWWLLPLALSIAADFSGITDRRQPPQALPGWPFDALLYGLVALQVANLLLAFRLIAMTGFFDWHTLVAVLLVGTSSGYSGIVVAHELIHRRVRHQRLLGRVLMGLVLYDHFATEHVRGHHVRVGTPEDPATARFGESFHAFLRRTLPGQFASAWRLECRRLGDERMPWHDRRQLGNQVLHGLVAEWAFAAGVAAVFGGAAFAFHLLQAAWAVRLLECVNYFEHWGLVRTGARVDTMDSWDTDSAFTLYTLVGLSRHADHHAHAARPFQALRHNENGPKLPRGYFGMVPLAIIRNRNFQRLMTEELARRQLGPFRPSAVSPGSP
jgi:alkane 1-monooxygenase